MESFQADNDALSCYDRIIDDIAGLALARMGLTLKVARYMKRVLTGFKPRIILGGTPSKGFSVTPFGNASMGQDKKWDGPLSCGR